MDEMPVDAAVPPPSHQIHYHGDIVRVLFVVAAVLMFLAEFTGAPLPFTTATSISIVVVLVVVAGITNPIQRWIQWLNVFISAAGLLVFGALALNQFRSGASFFSDEFFIGLLAITFLICLYFATRTLRAAIILHSFVAR